MFLKIVLSSVAICTILCSFVAGLYEQCNHVLDLKAEQKIYISSPYYPQKYPLGTSCRYTVKAPQDYKLTFKCNIQLNAPNGATRCYNEAFYFNREGSELLTDSEYFCGSGKMERKSFLNRAMISYVSTLPQLYKSQMRKEGGAAAAEAKEASASEAVAATASTKNVTTQELNGSQQAAPTKASVFDVATSRHEVLQFATEAASASGKAAPNAHALLFNSSGSLNSNSNSNTTTTAARRFSSEVTWSHSTLQMSAAGKKRARIVVNSGVSSTADYYGDSAVGGGRFSCLVEVVAAECECGWSMASAKIAGISQEAAVNEFPAMAGVQTVKSSRIFCGASIIHHRYLLSAAHCFNTTETNRSELLSVVVGEHDFSTVFESLYTRSYEIDAIISHEQFRPNAPLMGNDIALLRTRIPIEWSRSVGPACLPFYAIKVGLAGVRRPPVAGQRLDTAGWGTTFFGGPQSTRLLKTTLDVIAAERCRRALGSVPANSFCTYTPGTDTCQYDSGGALYARRQQRLFAVGIVSYGYACATQKPSVNTKVALYLKWILQQTPQLNYCNK